MKLFLFILLVIISLGVYPAHAEITGKSFFILHEINDSFGIKWDIKQETAQWAFVQSQKENPTTTLFNAVISGDINKTLRALEDGANINESILGNSPLYFAAMKGHAKIVNLLIRHGADINARTSISGRTALHEAALKGNFETVQVLINAGANINIRNKFGRTPLFYVTTPPPPLSLPSNHRGIAEFLRKNGGLL
jgi:ankyrin repeat protein